jgi:hypothetical protein
MSPPATPTLATFDQEREAQAFLRALRALDIQKRERMPRDLEVLERHGLAPVSSLQPD